ncbi:MAG: nickel-dependent lactate racemase, partial [archaeon]|nr:nickel-dependent lactate racemase [archaeon]
MKVDFQYGKSGLIFNIPEKYENVTILEPKEDIGLKDPVNEIYNSFQKPMSSKPLKLLLQRRKVGEIVIIVEDHTRPLKSKSIIEALIKIFSELNINDNEVKILVATGLHRSSTPDELERMLGIDIINRFDIIFHDANNKMDLDNIGENKFGNQIYLNSLYINAGFRIVTGYVEPHFFAGYSGGRKSLIPGIAGKETILNNHSAKNCDNENARFGFLKGNPIHEDASEAVKMAKPDFCINTIINSTHEITKVASGNITSVHNYLVQIQQKKCFSEIDKKFDIILCGNGGYPLDLNLYQSVKSMAIGEIAVKKGGIIISINECSDKVGQ